MDTRVHISIEVADLARSIEFYNKLFQQEPTGDFQDSCRVELRCHSVT
jgi:predicted enzyme related to lactoylglutathione lyase